ncbi:MAG: tetratricopeptide repeat protein, partial [Chloroflexi bacterium]|nr:tetratricopeptide repeat protein [Chloroflexota bacterium]
AERMAKASEEQKELLDSSFYFFYGSACERAGRFDRAVQLFRDAIKLNPENDEACNYLGYMFAEKGINLREAEGLIKLALKAQPKSGAYLDSMGWIYYRLGRHVEALKHLSAAAKTDAAKEDATVFEHLADVYLKLGKKKDAIEQLKKALQVEPDKKSATEKLKALETKSFPKPPAKAKKK